MSALCESVTRGVIWSARTCLVLLDDLFYGLFERDHVAMLVELTQRQVHLLWRQDTIASTTTFCCYPCHDEQQQSTTEDAVVAYHSVQDSLFC
jgi:hypothetical protein